MSAPRPLPPRDPIRVAVIGPHLAALGAVVLWGLSFVATKAVLAEIRPTTLIFSRFALGSMFLFALLGLRRNDRRLSQGMVPRLVLLGFIGVFVHQMLQVHGLQWTSATNTGWLIGLIPIWSALLAAIFLAERFSATRVAGLALGLAGALLIVGRGRSVLDLVHSTGGRGDLLVIASTVNWAIYTVYGRKAMRHGGGMQVTAYSMSFGSLLLGLPFVFARGWLDYPSLSASGWLALLFLGIGCSGAGYLCWHLALERLPAARVAAYLYVEPLVTQAAATALLGEAVSLTVTAGGVIVLLGVMIVQRPVSPAVESPERG